jgi:hypothetical protein
MTLRSPTRSGADRRLDPPLGEVDEEGVAGHAAIGVDDAGRAVEAGDLFAVEEDGAVGGDRLRPLSHGHVPGRLELFAAGEEAKALPRNDDGLAASGPVEDRPAGHERGAGGVGVDAVAADHRVPGGVLEARLARQDEAAGVAVPVEAIAAKDARPLLAEHVAGQPERVGSPVVGAARPLHAEPGLGEDHVSEGVEDPGHAEVGGGVGADGERRVDEPDAAPHGREVEPGIVVAARRGDDDRPLPERHLEKDVAEAADILLPQHPLGFDAEPTGGVGQRIGLGERRPGSREGGRPDRSEKRECREAVTEVHDAGRPLDSQVKSGSSRAARSAAPMRPAPGPCSASRIGGGAVRATIERTPSSRVAAGKM